MPEALRTACGFPLCPKLAIKGGRCADHQRKAWDVDRPPRAGGRAWQRTRARILLRDSHACRYCNQPAQVIDHVRCRAAGGSDDDSNLVAACEACNEAKRKQEVQGKRPMQPRPAPAAEHGEISF